MICLTKMLHDGSSPRVRGTLIKNAIKNKMQRFIPAGAGNALAW